jgi:FtsZ-binding cell division protein ZapB
MDKVATLHTPTGVYVEMRDYEHVCRERDEAAKRASDVTIECGRLEERLRHAEGAIKVWQEDAQDGQEKFEALQDRLAEVSRHRDEALRHLSLVKREARRWKQEFWNAWLGLVALQRWEDRSDQVALDLLRERDDASRALDMERAAHWATVKRLEEAERDRDPELDVIRAWQALADAEEDAK